MSPTLNKTLAANVRRLMEQRQWNQVRLARATRGEITQKTVSNVLAGLPCGMAIVEAIAKALDVEPWQLLVEPDSDVARLINAFSGANPEGRDLIQKLVERELLIGRRSRD
jgi:transcriptional regulator with XRE-family HTH domain